MKSEILFDEIGLIDDNLIVEANTNILKAKNKFITRKWLAWSSTVAACLIIILVVLLIPNKLILNPTVDLPVDLPETSANNIIEPPTEIITEPPSEDITEIPEPIDPIENIENNIDYRSTLYFINELNSPNLKSPESMGGVDYLSYTYPLDLDFLFIESRLVEYVGEDNYNNWRRAENANGTYLMVNMLTFIDRFNLTKEQFIEACNMYPAFPLFGDDLYKVADVLFSGDIEAVLRYTKTAGAVYSNGKLFSVEWLDTHTIEDYLAEGIDINELENAKEATLRVIRGFSKNPESLYQEKVEAYKITFPANDTAKTRFNAHIYEIEPFGLSFELPDGWTMNEQKPINLTFDLLTVWSKLYIYNANGDYAGIIGYNIYELYEGAEDEPMAIYGQIALGNNYHFDVRESYNIVKESDYGKTAVCDVYYSASINGGFENGTEIFNKGIVSYNKDLLVYIAIELENSAVSDDEWIAIAKSVEFIK